MNTRKNTRMKRRAFILSTLPVVALVTFFATAGTTHAAVQLPQDAIGVSEETFQLLKSTQSVSCTPETVGKSDSCPEIAKKLNGKIIFRAETTGAMYRFEYVGGIGVWSGLLERYIPDGFYSVGHKHYWVANGYRMRIRKNGGFARFLERMQTYQPSHVGLSQSDFQSLFTTCEYYGGDKTQFDSCLKVVEHAHKLTTSLQGKVVIAAEGDGDAIYIQSPELLHYLSPNDFFKVVKGASMPIRGKVMKHIPRVL